MTGDAIGRRVAVVGDTCAGKTTLAGQLARRLGAPHVELDALYWEPHWTPATRERFRTKTEQALAADAWVADGNYSSVRDIVWTRANTLVWLDYPLTVVLYRLMRRTLGRVRSSEVLWNGNRETVRGVLFDKDSLVLWAFRTHLSRRRRYEAALQQPEFAHLQVVRLRSPRETERWLSALTNTESARVSR